MAHFRWKWMVQSTYFSCGSAEPLQKGLCRPTNSPISVAALHQNQALQPETCSRNHVVNLRVENKVNKFTVMERKCPPTEYGLKHTAKINWHSWGASFHPVFLLEVPPTLLATDSLAGWFCTSTLGILGLIECCHWVLGPLWNIPSGCKEGLFWDSCRHQLTQKLHNLQHV